MSVISVLQRLPLRKIAPYLPVVRRLMPTAPVGLILAEGRMRLVALRQHREKEWELIQALDQPLPPGLMRDDQVLDGGGVTEYVGRIWEQYGLDPDNVILGLPAQFSAIRRGFVGRTMSLDELRAQVNADAIPNLRFQTSAAPNDVVRDVAILPGTQRESGMEVVSGIVTKAQMRDLQKAVREAGLVIHAIDHPGIGIYNAWRRTVKSITSKQVLLYLGPSRLLGVEVDLQGPRGIRAVELRCGTEYAMGLLQERLSSGESAEDILLRRPDTLQLYSGILEPWVSEVAQMVQQMVTRVAEGADPSTITIRLCGDGAQIAGLARLLSDRTSAQCEVLNPLHLIHHSSSGASQHPVAFGPFVPALGLALRYLDREGQQ